MNNFYINPDSSLFKQYQDFNIDHYANLEKELQSLTEFEISELANFQPYIEANNRLSILVQAELLNLVKGRINGNPEVIKQVVESVKLYKQNKTKELDELQDYIKNYPELSYNEYKELKYGKK